MMEEPVVPTMLKVEEDIDIGDEIPMNDYPPIEIERDAPSPASNVRSSNSSSSSSGTDSSSGKECYFLIFVVHLCSFLYLRTGVCRNVHIIFVCVWKQIPVALLEVTRRKVYSRRKPPKKFSRNMSSTRPMVDFGYLKLS